MHVTSRVPVSFKGRPHRSQEDKEIFAYETRSFDLREVSKSSMGIVYETFEAYDLQMNRGLIGAFRKDRHAEVRSFEGDLYRRVAKMEELPSLRLLDQPFPKESRTAYSVAFRSEISYIENRLYEVHQAACASLTMPLFEHFRWRLACEDLNTRRLANLWPTNAALTADTDFRTRGIGAWWARNHADNEDILRRLDSFDAHALAEARSLADTLFSGFIVVGGELWERCGPPVYRVMWTSGDICCSIVTIVHAPRFHDTNLATQYFPIGDKDAALKYADELARTFRANRSSNEPDSIRPRYSVIDHTVDHRIHDHDALAQDQGSDELFRISCAFAAENRRFLVRNAERQTKYGPDAVAGALDGFEEIRKTNHITGEFGDPSEWFDINASTWIRSGRHQGTYSIGESFVSNLLIDRAMRLHENRPIMAPDIRMSRAETLRTP